MADLSSVLLASLHPNTRKQAEATLTQLSAQPGFPQHLLQLVLTPAADRGARLAASVYFKNTVRRRWTDETDDNPLSEADKAAVRSQIVSSMIALSGAQDKGLRAQIAESVTVMAKNDFPRAWPTLIDELVGSFSSSDYAVNLAVLETAHSIFVRWRSFARSDQLFTEINLVLGRFIDPFIALFRQTATLLLSGGQSAADLAILAQAQTILVTLYYDLTCQDLPPALEDAHQEFFGPNGGWLLRFLAWDPPELAVDSEDTNPSLPSQLKTAVVELIQLYANLFAETLSEGGVIEALVQAVWEQVASGKRTAVSDDPLVSQALRMLATLVRQGTFAGLFQPAVIKSLVESVAVPNVYLRDVETEQFEDDPLEYIRRDMHVADGSTRRTAASDLLRALASSPGREQELNGVVGAWLSASLQRYASSPQENWKDKDAAICVLTAVAARGATTGAQGVTSTSMLIDVVEFFSNHIAQDLQAAPGAVHPILQVDAIKFLHTFRSQLTKEQLLQVLPLLVRHLVSDNYVAMTYASIAVERILFMKKQGQPSQPLFEPSDVAGFAGGIIDALFSRIEAGTSPEKVAENDFLMKCVMRVIHTTGPAIVPVYERILGRLITILRVIMQNPSNPQFSQFTFESIASLVRIVCAAKPEAVEPLQTALLPPIEIILQQDIDQFVHYAFQLLAQLLENYPENTAPPPAYTALVGTLMQPVWWSQRGSVPPLCRLLRAYLARAGAAAPVQGVLGVVQQRLIQSKINDLHGFDLLQALVAYAPFPAWSEYMRGILVTLLTRLQTAKTDTFVRGFVHWLLYVLAVGVEPGKRAAGLTPDWLVGSVNAIQGDLFDVLLGSFVVETVPQLGNGAGALVARERRAAIVGMARLLSESTYVAGKGATWVKALQATVQLYRKQPAAAPQESLVNTGFGVEGATEIDIEEANAGYQAAYARLASSESPRADPLSSIVPDEGAFLREALSRVPPQLLAQAGLDPARDLA